MKLTIFLAVALATVSASVWAQKVTLSGKNLDLKEVFAVIKKQTGYVVFVNEKVLEGRKKVTVDVRDMPLEKLLQLVLKEQWLGYTIQDKTIFVERKGRIPQLNEVVEEQGPPVKVKVVDTVGRPLSGATVSLKDKILGVTDAEGVFSLNVAEDDVLLVSYVGYEIRQVIVTPSMLSSTYNLIITLRPSVTKLKEIVYSSGYQDIPRERATGSFSLVDNELFNRRAGGTILQRISDVVPGVLSTRTAASNPLDGLKIRGVSTINSNKRSLVVVDNFIYEGDLTSINVNDIESITILKDAAAASIWGARAGNGVIVLTTKKARYNQKTNISFKTETTIGFKPDLSYIPSIPSKDIVNLERKRFADSIYNVWDDVYPAFNYYAALPLVPEILLAVRRGYLTPEEGEREIEKLSSNDIRDEIKKNLLRNSVTQLHSLSLSGGNEKYKYFTSLGYSKNTPNEISNFNEKIFLRFNQTYKIAKNLELGGDLNWTKSFEHNRNLLLNDNSYWTNPYAILKDEKGNSAVVPKNYRLSYVDSLQTKGILDWRYRPLDEARNGNQKKNGINSRILGTLSYTIMPGLSANLSYQWTKETIQMADLKDTATFYARNKINQFMQSDGNGNPIYPYPVGSIYNEINTNVTTWNFRGQLNWNKSWSERHSLRALLGIETSEAIGETNRVPEQYGFNENTYLFSPVLFGDWTTRPFGNKQRIGVNTSEISKKTDRFGSYYANVGYSFLNRYTLTTSGRVDRSNYFGVKSNDQIKPLWHIGSSWEISKEHFYNSDWLPYLKLRVTYGYSGNSNSSISPFATASYFKGTAPFFLSMASINSSPNPQLKWERVRTLNMGVDFEMKNRRVAGTVEFYRKNGYDLISSIDVDPTSGFSTYQGNNASISGKGIDLSINSKNLTGEFRWESYLIVSYNKEKVTSYLVMPPQTAEAYLLNPVVIGRPLNYLSSYKWAGLNANTGDTEIYIDGKREGSLASTNAKPSDLVYSGRTVPPTFGSLRNDFYYKGIGLSVNLNFRFGQVFRRSSFKGTLSTDNTWEHKDYLSAWEKSGDEVFTNVPGFKESYNDKRYQVYRNSDILIEKGDFIRLQDIRLSYQFPKHLTSRLRLAGASFFVYADNIGIIWRANKLGLDPDAYTFGDVPVPRTICFGLQVGL